MRRRMQVAVFGLILIAVSVPVILAVGRIPGAVVMMFGVVCVLVAVSGEGS
jgi:hypothetical protein